MNIRKVIDYSGLYAGLDEVIAERLTQMELYCEIGRVICSRSEKGAAVATSEYLTKRYPEMSGFSPRNVRRMRDFYRMYEHHSDLLQQTMHICWTQNVVILEAGLDMDVCKWYLFAVEKFGWTKKELQNAIENSVHEEMSLDYPANPCYTVNEDEQLENEINDEDTFCLPREYL